MTVHPIPPVFDENSRVLILGSFPSVKSRENAFFYGHPQNRFWRVLSAIFDAPLPTSIDEKRSLLLESGIAVWDVIASCDIMGSSDSSIKNVCPNDITSILEKACISAIFVNGKTAEKYYKKYIEHIVKRTAICLPSTSPANAAVGLDELVKRWSVIREYTDIPSSPSTYI